MIAILEFDKLHNSNSKDLRYIGFQLEELHDSLDDPEQKIKLREITEEIIFVIDELENRIVALREIVEFQ